MVVASGTKFVDVTDRPLIRPAGSSGRIVLHATGTFLTRSGPPLPATNRLSRRSGARKAEHGRVSGREPMRPTEWSLFSLAVVMVPSAPLVPHTTMEPATLAKMNWSAPRCHR
jgi:hypothetical protein